MKFFSFCFMFAFWTFMLVHYTHVKSPSISRDVASYSQTTVKPFYDASYKL